MPEDEVMKAYKAILTQLEKLTKEQQYKVVESVSVLIGYTKQPE